MYQIIKSGDNFLVVEADEYTDEVEHKIPVTLMGNSEEDVLCLVREIYHDTRLQYKYKTRQKVSNEYKSYLEHFDEDEDYIPDVTELFE
jgi:hypothetical protein